MRRTSSSRSCWYERSSRIGCGSGVSDEGEGIDEVVRPARADVDVRDRDVDEGGVVAGCDVHARGLDARLPRREGLLDVVLDQRAHGHRVGLAEVPPEAAA